LKIKRKIILAFVVGVIILSFILLSKSIILNNIIVQDDEKSVKADRILIGKRDITLYSKQEKVLANLNVTDGNIINSCVSDIDNDGNDEIIFLKSGKDSEYADEMVIESCMKVSGKLSIAEIYSFDCRDLKPWKVQTADVDGDGKKEISLGVYKTAAFHPVMAKRPFIYNWQGNGISPKWLGSRLSRPFEDYIFADIDGDKCDELIAIELLENGRKLIASYKWKGFGFEKNGESVDFKDVLSIKKGRSVKGKGFEIFADILEKTDLRQGVFIFNNDKLSLAN
jgi:hypothetical protein